MRPVEDEVERVVIGPEVYGAGVFTEEPTPEDAFKEEEEAVAAEFCEVEANNSGRAKSLE